VTGAEVIGAEVTGAEVIGAEVTGAEVTGAEVDAANVKAVYAFVSLTESVVDPLTKRLDMLLAVARATPLSVTIMHDVENLKSQFAVQLVCGAPLM